ncbi:hypothetical protein OSB04_012339 [Centaurea solstitialis]|uniref:Uncharacterized protein n=1 Tax=Centaurea solstitialis TaxID=347529 RepID=A0AA38TMX6_9ASTR|nr:hypothetical protein OSB04_012339 [Centaurea solstitialis]
MASLVLYLCCLLVLLSNPIQADSNDNRKVYVVYMGHKTTDDVSSSSLHLSMIQRVAGSFECSSSLLCRSTTMEDHFHIKSKSKPKL